MRYLIPLLFIFLSCTPTKSVMVIECLDNGMYHVVGMSDSYNDVIPLPQGISDGDIIKIRIKK